MFLYSHWLSLPITTRMKLAEIFNIPKKGSTEVVNNVIKHDGYDIKDIELQLNLGAIQEFLESAETDLPKLWDALILTVNGVTPVKIEPTVVAKPRKTKTK